MQLMKSHRNRRTPEVFGGLSQLYRELDDFFEPTSSRWPSPFRTFGILEGNWSPSIDLYNEKEAVRVKAELPGLKKGEFNVSVQGDTLILEGERKQDFEEKKENYHRIERLYGQFHRAVTLPAPVEAKAVKATYRDGILEVVLPKREEAKPKQIEVEISK